MTTIVYNNPFLFGAVISAVSCAIGLLLGYHVGKLAGRGETFTFDNPAATDDIRYVYDCQVDEDEEHSDTPCHSCNFIHDDEEDK